MASLILFNAKESSHKWKKNSNETERKAQVRGNCNMRKKRQMNIKKNEEKYAKEKK